MHGTSSLKDIRFETAKQYLDLLPTSVFLSFIKLQFTDGECSGYFNTHLAVSIVIINYETFNVTIYATHLHVHHAKGVIIDVVFQLPKDWNIITNHLAKHLSDSPIFVYCLSCNRTYQH